MDKVDSLKKDLATAMTLLDRMELERISADPQNLEMLDEISRQTDLIQTKVNLLYKRIYSKNGFLDGS